MAKKNKFDYFDAFKKQAEVACKEADVLIEATEHFVDSDHLRKLMELAHRIEQEGDEVNHDILHNVAVDFITPIDREDIIALSQRLDTVIDDIEDAVQCLYMYDAHVVLDSAIELAELIKEASDALYRAMDDFRHFKKSDKVRDLLEEVNTCEEKADYVYLSATRRLYTEDRENVMRVIVWSRILDRMEKTSDACEHVADTMNDIILKHT